jgi:N-acetylglucosamine-6-sulfatase
MFINRAIRNLTACILLALINGAVPCEAQSSGSTPIPPSFFAMCAVRGDYPKVTLGTLGHQEFAWGRVEGSRGAFNFQPLDNYVDALKQHGLVDTDTNTANMAITLSAGTPSWAVADQSTCSPGANGTTLCTAPPDNIQDWKDFLNALIQHYNGTTQPHIRYYELWNEFNVNLWWTGTDAQMLALAQAASPIIHQDPNSLLLTPSVAGPVGTVQPNSGVTVMTNYLRAGGAQYADGGAFHGYIAAQNGVNPFPMPEDDSTPGCKAFVTCYGSIITKATQMRAVFDQNGLAGKPMFQTEGSWGNQTVTDLDAQIGWVTRYFLLQAGLRSTLNLQMAAWFTWGGGTTFGWGDIEDASLNPTPAGFAYDEVYHWIVGATIDSPCSSASNGTWTCTLKRPGGYIAQAVWNTNGSISYAPGPGYTQYRDLTGQTFPIPGGGSVPIGAKPVLISGSTAAPAGAPNVLLILTDDQDVQTGMLAYMPHLQELLVNQGTSFSNYLVPLSLCCPSRTALLRGQFPHNTGVLTNALPNGGFAVAYNNNVEASTLATVLHGAGYRTVLFGKYLNGYPPAGNLNYIPPGWDEWYSPAAGDPYGEYNYTLNENGTQVSYGSTPADYGTDVYYGKALDFINRAAATPSQPIFLYFAVYAPHEPYVPAPRHASLFPTLSAPRPPSFNEPNVSDKPAYISSKPLLSASDISGIDDDFRNRVRSLQAVDEAIAGLVSALSSTGRLANTYIFFASDNGYHMGEHRLLPGKYTPYETDIHVPLIVRGPGVPAGVVRTQYAANIDLAETFVDLAGLAAPSYSDGRSLKGLLQNPPTSSWRQAFFLEEFGTGEFDPPDTPASVLEPLDKSDLATVVPIPSYFGFQAPAYKYIEYKSGEKELYLTSDQYELTNLAGKVSPSVAATLAAYVNTFEGCQGDGCRAAEAVAPPPLLTADFTVSPAVLTSVAPATLTATATGTAPYSYNWTIDATNKTGSTVSIQLANGSHSVSLSVQDGIGALTTVTKTIFVGSSKRRAAKH